jgi:PrtD family type I secretion system ABC transporter
MQNANGMAATHLIGPGDRRASEPGDMGGVWSMCRPAIISVTVFSMFINLLMLTGPLFMLQVFDRVLSSGSVPTLVALTILVGILYALYGFLEFVRSRVVARVARITDESLRERVFDAVAYHAVHQTPEVRNQPIQDLQITRQFLQSPGPFAFLDMPWTPLYLLVIYLLHPVLGIVSTLAVVLLVSIAVVNELVTRRDLLQSHQAAQRANLVSDESRANAEVATVLGMLGAIRRRWLKAQDEALDSQSMAGDRGGILTSLSRALRLMFQSVILAVGAYLAVKQQLSPGGMIAASILMARALAPVEMTVAHWAGFQACRQAWTRLAQCLKDTPRTQARMDLPAPSGHLTVEDLTAFAPNADKQILSGISFNLPAGSGLGIIGPTGAGKSTLARAIVGAWPAMHGTVRLNGAAMDQWDPAVLGAHLGYLPQEVELFDGTIAENIARFSANSDTASIVKAAEQASVHELVLKMPDGYNTQISEGGAKLSAGQRQRIGLARALYGDPALVVLDEPNSNLDAEGESALIQAMGSVRQRGGTVIVVAHRPSAISVLDQLMMIKDGQMVAFGPRDEVLRKVVARPVEVPSLPVAPRPVEVASLPGASRPATDAASLSAAIESALNRRGLSRRAVPKPPATNALSPKASTS